jgi:hypothetical protein
MNLPSSPQKKTHREREEESRKIEREEQLTYSATLTSSILKHK